MWQLQFRHERAAYTLLKPSALDLVLAADAASGQYDILEIPQVCEIVILFQA